MSEVLASTASQFTHSNTNAASIQTLLRENNQIQTQLNIQIQHYTSLQLQHGKQNLKLVNINQRNYITNSNAFQHFEV